MDQIDYQYAQAKLVQLKADYQVDVLADWGYGDPDHTQWKTGTWTKSELDKLHNAIALMAGILGGKFIQDVCGTTVAKADIGTHGGEALAHRVTFSIKGTFSSWTV